jgi:hypothetical protein
LTLEEIKQRLIELHNETAIERWRATGVAKAFYTTASNPIELYGKDVSGSVVKTFVVKFSNNPLQSQSPDQRRKLVACELICARIGRVRLFGLAPRVAGDEHFEWYRSLSRLTASHGPTDWLDPVYRQTIL